MTTNILWRGLAYHSFENCRITKKEKGWEADSTIVGADDDKIYKVDYLVKTNSKWEVVFFELTTQLLEKNRSTIYQSDGKGNWTRNGMPEREFTGCIDVDLSLTPFTNSLPINRLQLETNDSRQIKVLFADVLGESIVPVEQRYTKISETEFKFENVPNDFEAVIEVDEFGLVVNYPELFVRNARQDYP